MKRRLFKLVVFLLLGAIVNVAVAWGCAYWVDSSPSDMSRKYVTRRTPQGHVWFIGIESERGAERVLSTRLFDPGGIIIDDVDPSDLIPSWSTISRDFDPAEPKTWDQQMQDARGWPMLSMRCTFCCTGRTLIVVHECEVVGGRELPRRTSNGYDISTLRALPYIPIPLGFVVNTLFYAALLWSLAFGPFTARRMIRRNRGHCIKCGYDLRGAEHEACPECGCEVCAGAKSAQGRSREAVKRRLTKLVVFLLLGAILNVAVAWGCATWSLSAGVRRVDVPWHLLKSDRRAFYATKVGISCGWPRLCLFRRLTEIETIGHGFIPGSHTEYGLVVTPKIWELLGGQTWPRLPLRPIWPGFAINTIFYAAIVWVLWSSPFTARRMIRRRRGHCINCGYDLRGAEHEVCPECGS